MAQVGSRTVTRERSERHERVLGGYTTGLPGPLVLVLGAIHGNEPAGVYAAKRVLDQLAEAGPRIRGSFVALTGNMPAVESAVRYIDEDLNRVWSATRLAELAQSAANGVEHGEQRELLREIESRIAGNWEQVVFLDLHSMSANGAPFSIIGDTLQNRKIAFGIGIPVILGLEENVDGTLLGLFGDQGYIAVGMEGGQHDDPRTVDHHESAIWATLVSAGALDAAQVPDFERHKKRLAAATEGLPPVLEIRHREAVTAGDGFRMEAGFASFQSVRAGELLAHKAGERVEASEDGLLLMPLYQGQGTDGFFVARPVRKFWLHLSTALRRLRAGRLLPLLPGVRRRAKGYDELEVDRHIARWLSVQVFHLLGYRKGREDGPRLVFTRRAEGRSSAS